MAEVTDAVVHQLIYLDISSFTWISAPFCHVKTLVGKHLQFVTEWILLVLFAGGLRPAVGPRTTGHKRSRYPHPLGSEQCCSGAGRSNFRRDLPTASGDSPRVEPTHQPEAREYWDGVGGLQAAALPVGVAVNSALLFQVQRVKIALMQIHVTSQQRVVQLCAGTVQPGLISRACPTKLDRSETQAQVLTSCHPVTPLVCSPALFLPTSTFQNLLHTQFEGTTCSGLSQNTILTKPLYIIWT